MTLVLYTTVLSWLLKSTIPAGGRVALQKWMNYNRCKGLEFIARVMKIVAVTAGMPVDLLFPSVRNQILVNLIGFCHAQPQLNYILTQTNAEVSTIYTFQSTQPPIHPGL